MGRLQRRKDLRLGRGRRFSRFFPLTSDAGRVLEKADERLLERLGVPRFDQLLRSVGGQDLAGVHERDAVATQRLVHEVRGEKDRHLALRERSIRYSQNPSRATGSTPDVGSSRISMSGRCWIATANCRR